MGDAFMNFFFYAICVMFIIAMFFATCAFVTLAISTIFEYLPRFSCKEEDKE